AVVPRAGFGYSGTCVPAFSPDGRRLIAIERDTRPGPGFPPPQDERDDLIDTIKVWEVPSGRELARTTVPRLGVWHYVFSPDGRRLVWSIGRWSVKACRLQVWDWAAG